MPRRRLSALLGALALSSLAVTAPATASFGSTPSTPLVIGVDHIDQANQQPFPPYSRLFEYNDFFTRNVTVHQGDTIDFQTQAGAFHIIAFARNEAAARRAYPGIMLDMNDMPAVGTGLPKIIFGPGNFPVMGGSTHGGGMISANNGKGPPVCGAVQFNEQPCTFRGGNDVEVVGPTVGYNLQQQPATIDQNVTITAGPGVYSYFDMLHPGMSGTLRVVPARAPATTQAQIDARSQVQFNSDRQQALAVEAALNHPQVSGQPGYRTVVVHVGAGAANNHVEIDEMLPNVPQTVSPGDQIKYVWTDGNAMHNVGFAHEEGDLPEPFGYDCSPGVPGYLGVPNILNTPQPPACTPPGSSVAVPIGDPGMTPSGTTLTSPSSMLDSGLLIGKDYGVSPTAQTWTVLVGDQTAPGTYSFFCTVHGWMAQQLDVT